MKKILLACAVLLVLANLAEAQSDTFYIHSAYHYGVEIHEDAEEFFEGAQGWPAKYVVEDSSMFGFAQNKYKKIGLKGEPQEWVCSDCCDNLGYDYIYKVECGGKILELKISKYRNEERNCGRTYSVDGYVFHVFPYPPEDKELYDDSIVYIVVQDDPEFPGGIEALHKFLAENLRYPSWHPDVVGNVYVTFIVERDGTITNARVLRDLCDGCGEEALRVVNAMPKWIPGKQRGKPVRVRFNLPINFSLH